MMAHRTYTTEGATPVVWLHSWFMCKLVHYKVYPFIQKLQKSPTSIKEVFQINNLHVSNAFQISTGKEVF
jgi:hypothetical protein